VHPVYRVHRPMGGGGSPVHRGPGGGVGGMGMERGPQGLLEEKGAEGNLTVVGDGRHENGARLATSFNGGGYLLSTTRGSRRGETKVGEALDAVESVRGVGAFYRSRMVGGGRSRSNWRRLGGASMGRWFRALIRHRGEGKQRGGTGRGSVGDAEARGGGGTEVALSTTTAGQMGGAAASDRRREMTWVGRCWAERLLWLGPTLGNSKEN
jgi:hypothetical protein